MNGALFDILYTEKEEKIKRVISNIINNCELDIFDIVDILLNRDKQFLVNGNVLCFESNDNIWRQTKFKDEKTLDYILNQIIWNIDLPKSADIINYLKHNLSCHLLDNKKSSLGKYYTKKHIVQLVMELVEPHIRKDSIIMDLCAGCGAFLEYFENRKIIGRDIDRNCIRFLKQLGYTDIDYDNSLLNVSREKYGISNSDHIIIVGNPPYNDRTSRNKRFGRNAKDKIDLPIDSDLKSRDIGISFLKAFTKLKADVICILHPLSYLIKKANFELLNEFPKNYMLKDAIIFSSQEFGDTQATPFPIIAALYLKGNMDYNYIRKFKFKIYDSNRQFVLEKVETIDDDNYIRKYPPKKGQAIKSDIGLYMNNIRDINSLITKGYFSEIEDHDRFITIQYKELYKYAYLDCMKRYFDKDYLFGNLSPIVERDKLENDEFMRDVFVIDTIINNQKFKVFNKENKDSPIWKDWNIETIDKKNKQHYGKKPCIYEIIKDFLLCDINRTSEIKEFIKAYFNELKNKFLR